MGRSRKHRKRFACGHRGFGQWCHCCADANNAGRASANHARYASTIAVADFSVCLPPRRRSSQHRAKSAVLWDKQAWKDSFASDSIDLRRLPRAIVLKARGILTALSEGVGYWQLKGKRLRGDRSTVKIPVSYRYRLLCRLEGKRLMPLKVLSHED